MIKQVGTCMLFLLYNDLIMITRWVKFMEKVSINNGYVIHGYIKNSYYKYITATAVNNLTFECDEDISFTHNRLICDH